MPSIARLSTELILEGAVRLLQEEGLDALTIRRLAARLGVEGPSLYKHFASKQQLLGHVTLHLLSVQIAQVGEQPCWQEWLLVLGRVLWSTQTRIRDSARLVATTEFEPTQIEAMSSMLSEQLRRHGIPAHVASSMHFSVQALVLGLSTLSEGRSADVMRDLVPFDTVLEDSLQALVAGWSLKLEHLHVDRSRSMARKMRQRKPGASSPIVKTL